MSPDQPTPPEAASGPNAQKEQLEFLRLEFSSHQTYYTHLEGKLFQLVVAYYTFLFAVSSATAYFATLKDAPRPAKMVAIFLLAAGFVFVGRLIMWMYLELRIRKIRLIEQIMQIRQRYTELDASLEVNEWLSLPAGIENAPPYLRRPSEDWYSLVFMAFLNGLALGFSLSLLALEIAHFYYEWLTLADSRVVVALVALTLLIGMTVFVLQLRRITCWAYGYDLARRKKHPSMKQYDWMPPMQQQTSAQRLLKLLDRLASRWESSMEQKR